MNIPYVFFSYVIIIIMYIKVCVSLCVQIHTTPEEIKVVNYIPFDPNPSYNIQFIFTSSCSRSIKNISLPDGLKIYNLI